MKGTVVNVVSILAGSAVGLLIKSGIPEKSQNTIMQGLGMATFIIGVQMAIKSQNILIVILSIVTGALVGETLKIDKRLQCLGDWMTKKVGNRYGNVGEGFITASLVYCVGAMAIVGAIQDGLTGDASILYAKSILDGVLSIVLTSSMGIGVALSSLSILVYQGGITLLAGQISSVFSEAVVREMTAVGGVLILGIAMIIMDVKKINVANLLPAIPLAAIITVLWP
jgi:uncharacterized membrane protein YqgA involved in biofilm formation